MQSFNTKIELENFIDKNSLETRFTFQDNIMSLTVLAPNTEVYADEDKEISITVNTLENVIEITSLI